MEVDNILNSSRKKVNTVGWGFELAVILNKGLSVISP